MVVDMVDDQAKGIVHNAKSRLFVAPLALTVFLWIILMNALDLLPVDLLPSIWRWTGLGAEHGDPLYYHRILPTADLNVPMGMSLGVLLMFYYGIKIKHPGGFVRNCSPRRSMPMASRPWCWPLQPAAEPDRIRRQVRLAGHAVIRQHVRRRTGLHADRPAGRRLDRLQRHQHRTGHRPVLAGSVWAIFHILIVLLQAFIFMMLTLVYLGQAHEGH